MAKRSQTPSGFSLDEIGASGLSVSGGMIYEEPLVVLSGDGWRRTLREMMNDAVVNGILLAIEMLARQVTWGIKPFSEEPEYLEDAEFTRGALMDDMSVTWQDTLSEILSFLPWGWSYFETCYKRRGGESRDKKLNSRFSDGRIGWRKFAIRSQESLTQWIFDDFDEVSAMEQQPAPDYNILTVPIDKALHFRTSSHKNNPEGRSILRGAYREWYFKVNIQNIEGIGIERDLAGLPVFYAPAELFDASASTEKKLLLESLRRMVKQVRRDEAEGLVIPMSYDADTKKQNYEFTLLTTAGKRQFDTSQIIDRCDHRILLSILADFMMLGSKSTGSYALSTDKTELFSSAMSAWLDSICETFNRDAIPKLQKLNGRPSDRSPKLFHGDVEQISLKDLGEFLQQTSGLGITLDPEEQAWVKQQAGIPVTPESKKSKEQSPDDTDEKDDAKEV